MAIKYRVRGTGQFWDARGGPVVIQDVDRVVESGWGGLVAADTALEEHAATIPELAVAHQQFEMDMDWQGQPRVERVEG